MTHHDDFWIGWNQVAKGQPWCVICGGDTYKAALAMLLLRCGPAAWVTGAVMPRGVRPNVGVRGNAGAIDRAAKEAHRVRLAERAAVLLPHLANTVTCRQVAALTGLTFDRARSRLETLVVAGLVERTQCGQTHLYRRMPT